MTAIMTPGEMRDFLATLLEGAAGGTRDRWFSAIGPVEKLPTHLNLRSNWAVHPKGKKLEREAVERAVEIARREHPYVADSDTLESLDDAEGRGCGNEDHVA